MAWMLITTFGYLERFCWKTVMCILEVGHTSVRMGRNCQVLQWYKWISMYLSTRCSEPRVLDS